MTTLHFYVMMMSLKDEQDDEMRIAKIRRPNLVWQNDEDESVIKKKERRMKGKNPRETLIKWLDAFMNKSSVSQAKDSKSQS